MNTKNDGGPAFPENGARGQAADGEGMSLRDYFAAKAMQVLLEQSGDEWPMTFDDVADNAYAMADSMLAAREPQQ